MAEYHLKAAFLFNFTRFVEWPQTAVGPADAPFVIGIVGQDPFGGALDAVIREETVNGRTIVVKRFQRTEELKGCHILFIGRSETARLTTILAQIDGKAILSVSDIDRFAQMGGVIGLVMDQEKVRIQINVESARMAHLALSAKLLQPAQLVTTARAAVMRVPFPKENMLSSWRVFVAPLLRLGRTL